MFNWDVSLLLVKHEYFTGTSILVLRLLDLGGAVGYKTNHLVLVISPFLGWAETKWLGGYIYICVFLQTTSGIVLWVSR